MIFCSYLIDVPAASVWPSLQTPDLGSRNRPFSRGIPEWMAQSAVVCGGARLNARTRVLERRSSAGRMRRQGLSSSQSSSPRRRPKGAPVNVSNARRLLGALLFVPPLVAAVAIAAGLPPALELPKPKLDSAATLVSALKARKSAREFSPEPLSLQALSDLLWAADGMNRDDGRRTAPSAKNWQEIDVYAVLRDGMYLYDAKAHALRGVVAGDLRAATVVQDFVAAAPLNLVYVAYLSRMSGASPGDRDFYAAADAAFVSQNVYLWCAATGLSMVVRGSVDRPALAKALGLRPDQRILLAQTVGIPK